jgi:tripartite-type tricarboxylate transporter receptor subunit TctC
MKRLQWMVVAVVGLCCALSNSVAQNFPNKPIQIIVPVAAGGGTDLLARTLGQKVSELLGQPVVIDNRLGAGGNIGVEMVVKAKPDGYTLILSPGTIATNVAVYRKLPYDLVKDLQTVTLVGQTGSVLVVHPSIKANNVREFVELAKASPGELNFGSAGMGSPQHLHAEFFNQLAGTKTNHIPYKGQSQAMTDLVGGQLAYMFSPLQNALPYIQQGRIRVLTVAASHRNPKLPDVPSLAEVGYKGVDLANLPLREHHRRW